MRIKARGRKISIRFSQEEIEKYWTPEELSTGEMHVDRLQQIINTIEPNCGIVFFLQVSTGEVNHLVVAEERRRIAAARKAMRKNFPAGSNEEVAVFGQDLPLWLDCRPEDIVAFENAGLLTRLPGTPVRYRAEEVFGLRGCYAEFDPSILRDKKRGQATLHPLTKSR